LLRFIGRLAINQVVHDIGGGLFWDGNQALSVWELENVGVTQAGAGAQLLSKWGFSEVMVQAVGDQERPQPDPSAAPLVLATHFAARLLPSGIDKSFIDTLKDQPLNFPADHPFVVAHNLTPADVDVVRAEAYRALLAIRDNLYS